MPQSLSEPWPWYVSGPLIGLMVPWLLILGNRRFGVSSSFRHLCAALLRPPLDYLRYDWRAESWNLFFVAGMAIGGFCAVRFFSGGGAPAISAETVAALRSIGIGEPQGIAPQEIFAWNALFSRRGLACVVLGGFLVGFGTRYANGCTSGHGIFGLADRQWPSLVAVCGFFAGGLLITHGVLPWLWS